MFEVLQCWVDGICVTVQLENVDSALGVELRMVNFIFTCRVTDRNGFRLILFVTIALRGIC